jgi:hypothetical protein
LNKKKKVALESDDGGIAIIAIATSLYKYLLMIIVYSLLNRALPKNRLLYRSIATMNISSEQCDRLNLGRENATERATKKLTQIEIDIEEAHFAACKSGDAMYIDPRSGYSVMTRDYLLKRNKCCGSKCRHCPYNHINVKIK